MTTYTLAFDGDVLMATARDGDDAALGAALSWINEEDRAVMEARITYVSGLTLYATCEDADAAEEAGAEIVHAGPEMGWIFDEAGVTHHAAGRAA